MSRMKRKWSKMVQVVTRMMVIMKMVKKDHGMEVG